jgi:hypothetical protein
LDKLVLLFGPEKVHDIMVKRGKENDDSDCEISVHNNMITCKQSKWVVKCKSPK